MAAFDFHEKERRRSVRTRLAIPITVKGHTRTGEEFTLEAETHTVSDSGCLINANEQVGLSADQVIALLNEKTGQSIKGRVVSTWRHPRGKIFVGVEFLVPSEDFWRSELPSSNASVRSEPKQ